MQRRIALVHAEEVAGEEGRLVAARAGPHLQDGAAVVGLVARHEQRAQLAADDVELVAERDPLVLGERPHVALRRRVGDERLGLGELAFHAGQHARLLGHGVELGELARQAHIFVALGAGGEHRHHRVVAVDQRAQTLLGNRDSGH